MPGTPAGPRLDAGPPTARMTGLPTAAGRGRTRHEVPPRVRRRDQVPRDVVRDGRPRDTFATRRARAASPPGTGAAVSGPPARGRHRRGRGPGRGGPGGVAVPHRSAGDKIPDTVLIRVAPGSEDDIMLLTARVVRAERPVRKPGRAPAGPPVAG
ncbi:hypothetical protein AB5J52_04695 [Streptomyces sp. R39]|uniref:Uncharacterized protein n=1 Tax=Streptomyces sp. R39 TaxID=3238631 RepID=A0AB39QFT0_9ACTN